MIHQVDIFGDDKVQKAIKTIQFFEPKDGSGYWLAFSGGKDSVVVKALMDMAGVKYESHYQVTSVDPPELVRFIKEGHPDVVFDFPRYENGERITMWNLIPKKKMPPTRLVRYCCQSLKEGGGQGRICVTGVRWAESSNRKNNQGAVTIPVKFKKEEGYSSFTKTPKGGVVLGKSVSEIILNNDNDEKRELMDFCIKQRKTLINPIIDWDDSDVWEFIHEYNIKYCSLYDERFKRLGCIGCPMSNKQDKEFERWPVYKLNYIKAFQRMIDQAPEKYRWKTGEDVFNWWIGDKKNESNQKEWGDLSNTGLEADGP